MAATENGKKLTDYVPCVGVELIDEIRKLGSLLRGRCLQHINSTRIGGGVAEILSTLVPMLEEAGLETYWDVIDGTPGFFEITKSIHNALHGQREVLTPDMRKTFLDVGMANRKKVRNDADFVVIHDPQPLPLVLKKGKRKVKRIWRCHIDLSHADPFIWGFLRRYVEICDASIFHLPEYTRDITIDQYIIPPAIDPLSPKNVELPEREVDLIVERLGIDPELPLVAQVSRFDFLKDPVGVIEAYKRVTRWHECQLVLAGGAASDDPEGEKVLQAVFEARGNDHRIHVLNLPPDSHVEINAIQRKADVIVQKSLREGFGLVVTEAMWKGKPVIGGAVGGIKRQILHGISGYLVQSVEGTAYRIRQLLASPEQARKMGEMGREYVKNNFLIPHLLRSWLSLLLLISHPDQKILDLSSNDFAKPPPPKRKKEGPRGNRRNNKAATP